MDHAATDRESPFPVLRPASVSWCPLQLSGAGVARFPSVTAPRIACKYTKPPDGRQTGPTGKARGWPAVCHPPAVSATAVDRRETKWVDVKDHGVESVCAQK